MALQIYILVWSTSVCLSSSLYLLADARREARKAFLAFSSSDAKAQLADSEPGEVDRESFLDQPINDDVHSSRSTPVRTFSWLILYIVLPIFFLGLNFESSRT